MTYVSAIVYRHGIVSTAVQQVNRYSRKDKRIRYKNPSLAFKCDLFSQTKHFISEKIYSVVMLLQKKWQFIYFSFARMESPAGSVRTSAYTLMAGWHYGFQRSGSFFNVFFLMLCTIRLLKQCSWVHFAVLDEMRFFFQI